MITVRVAVILTLFVGTSVCGCRETPVSANEPLVPSHKPTQVLKNFEMNDAKNGLKTMTLHSVEGRIFESQQYADVDQPIVSFYKEGNVSSRLRSPAGRVQTETHAVEMWGGVTVVSADSTTLTTEHLNYDPKTRTIYSKDAVRLEKPDSVTDGIGLETDPELKTVKIGHQKVRFKKGVVQ